MRLGVVPAELFAAWSRRPDPGQETLAIFTSMFLHANLHPPRGQPHLPVDLRQQHRGPPRADPVPAVLPRRRHGGGGSPDRDRPELGGPDGRRLGRDLGGPGGLCRVVPGCPDPVPRLPRLLLPAHRGTGAHRPRALVRSSSSSTGSARSVWPGRRAASRSSPTSAGSWRASSWECSSGRRAADARIGGGGLCRERAWDNPAMANEEPLPGTKLVEMVVESVRVHMLSSRHVVILKETERDRYLPIWIGPWEASAIAMKLQGLAPDRPLTHDLFAAALEGLGARVDRVIISSLAEETFHARLMLEHDGRTIEVDARPSDCARPGGPGRRPDLRRRGGAGAGGARADAGRRRRGGRGDGRHPLESTGEQIVDPRLDVFRDFVELARHRPGHRRSPRRRSSRRAAGVGPAALTHVRCARFGAPAALPPAIRDDLRPLRYSPRSAEGAGPVRPQPEPERQKSRTARKNNAGLGPGRGARRAGMVRDADLGDRPSGGPELDQQLGREERAARLDARCRRAPRAGTACRRSRRRGPSDRTRTGWRSGRALA